MKTCVALYLLAIAIALSGCSRNSAAAGVEASASAPAIQVKLAKAQSREVERSIAVTGSLAPDESVNLSFEVAGTLARVRVDFGQTARQGQVLAELDQREAVLQVERSRAALAQAMARAGLKAGEEGASPESSPAVRQSLAQFEDARSKFESARKLVASGDISRERYTELEKSMHAREAAYQATRDELRMQLASTEGLRAEVKLAEKKLGDTVMRAPFDGAVTAKLISPGQFVKENVAILTFVKSSPLRLRAELPESAVGEVHAGTPLTFTTDAAPGAVFHAVVRELNPSLDREIPLAHRRSPAGDARSAAQAGHVRPGQARRDAECTHRGGAQGCAVRNRGPHQGLRGAQRHRRGAQAAAGRDAGRLGGGARHRTGRAGGRQQSGRAGGRREGDRHELEISRQSHAKTCRTLHPATRVRHHAHRGAAGARPGVVSQPGRRSLSQDRLSQRHGYHHAARAHRPKRSKARSPSASRRRSTPSAASTSCARCRPKAYRR